VGARTSRSPDSTYSTVNLLLSGAARFFGRNDLFESAISTGLRIADMNGDTHPDVVDVAGFCSGLSCGGSLGVYLGDGTGAFGARLSAALYDPDPPANNAPGPLDIADFNDDGKLDVVVCPQRRPKISLFLGNGDGTFIPVINSHYDEGFATPAAGDFNEDGFADLAGGAKLYRGLGNGQFDNAGTLASGGPYVVRDFNGDDHLDILYAVSNAVAVQLGHGDLTFDAPLSSSSPNGPGALVSEDFDGDGIDDVVQQVSASNWVAFLKGNGDGTFAAPVPSSQGVTSRFVAFDVDGDGVMDIASSSNADPASLRIAEGDGDGMFGVVGNASAAVATGFMAAGDVNHDGADDAIVSCWTNYTGNLGNAVISVLLGMPVVANPVAVEPRLESGSLSLAIRPTPSRMRATIDFVLPSAGHVVVEVLDLAGRRVAELHHGPLEAGAHSMIWRGTNATGVVTPGIYFARVNAGGRQATKRLVWIP
jgi:hypothetical protein